ncbi:MAG: hypothetical protein FD123_3716 [Bacteroidetes bacterium]|nr:MAG: hypothetical protein FD123_3716 [Bacteroidota bacterium]
MKKTILFSALALLLPAGIFAQQRIVLIEQFTNSGCPPCAMYTPQVTQYADNNPATTAVVAYHTSFPYNDSMYFENPAESNQRVNFYNVPAVPHTVLDGNQFSGGSSSFVPGMAAAISSRAAVAAQYDITAINPQVSGNVIQGAFVFTSQLASNTGDSLRAHIVVIEKNVLKSAYLASPGNNSETVYKYVMRKMLPDANGSFLVNRQLNGTDTISFSWNMQNIKSVPEVRVVAFVQNITTQEVYMAVMSTPSIATGAEDIARDDHGILVFPNPAGDYITIGSAEPFSGTVLVKDIQGRETLAAQYGIVNEKYVTMSLNGLAPGFYLLVFRNEQGEFTRKITVK